jgi:fructosamine-3-kinase
LAAQMKRAGLQHHFFLGTTYQMTTWYTKWKQNYQMNVIMPNGRNNTKWT